MFVHYRTKGLIFKKEDRGDADQLFTVFTKEFGKLEISAKAIRKISSKLRSGAEIFYLSEIEFIQGKAQKTLTDAVLVEKFADLKKDLGKLKIAYKISDVLDKLIRGQEPDLKIWNLILETFYGLKELKNEDGKLEIIYYYFLWNFLSILGYQPNFYHCILCEEKLKPETLYFDLAEGGIVCESCHKKTKAKLLETEPETIKILRAILKKDWLTVKRLKIEIKNQKPLKLISDNFLSEALDKTQ